MRHNPEACPLCGERIEKTARGGRRKYSCQKCGASINRLLICDRCGTKRVWQGKKGSACSGCGVARYAAIAVNDECRFHQTLRCSAENRLHLSISRNGWRNIPTSLSDFSAVARQALENGGRSDSDQRPDRRRGIPSRQRDRRTRLATI